MNTLRKGARGELLAREFLESCGYHFVDANFRRRVGEIDLIMLTPDSDKPRTIVFVEVRYRASAGFGGALGSIDWKKQRKMARAARAWLQKNATSRDCARIDVIAIEPNEQAPDGGASYWKGHHLIWIKNAVEEPT